MTEAKRKAYRLEVCADSIASVKAAAAGGADRIELCDNLIIGGTTPSPVFYEQVKRAVNLPVHILVRPRFGDFLYSAEEIDRMAGEIKAFHGLGVEGFVIGALRADGSLNTAALRRLIQAGAGARFVLHRAFDMTGDLQHSLKQAIELGFTGILTSGGEGSALQGAEMLKRLKKIAAGQLEIIAGAGIGSANLKDLLAQTGAGVYHLSGKKRLVSQMQYRNEKVFMGLPGFSEYESFVTDEAEIRKVAAILMAAERSANVNILAENDCDCNDGG